MARSSRGGHGGARTPAHPAAVSGPGALSQRTDGGPSQPVRVAPGGDYGSRAASVAQQQSAPMAAVAPSAAGGGVPSASMAPLPTPFGPSQRPNEPVTAGAALGPGAGAPNPREDALAALQALFAVQPLPELQDMIMQAQRELGR